MPLPRTTESLPTRSWSATARRKSSICCRGPFPKRRAVIPVPSYADYERAAELSGLSVEKVFLKEHQGFRLDVAQLESKLKGDELVFLGQPNNPTGLPCDVPALRDLAGKHPATIFIVDEAFADFVEGLDRLAANRPANVVVLCSLTKFYAIPGLRLGCAMADRNHGCESAPCHAALDGEHPGAGGRCGGAAGCRLRRGPGLCCASSESG